MRRVNEVIHGNVGNELMLIHCGSGRRVDELHSVIKRQGVSGRGVAHWARVVTDYGSVEVYCLRAGRPGARLDAIERVDAQRGGEGGSYVGTKNCEL